MSSVSVERIVVSGWEAPHGVRIGLVGELDETMDDRIVRVMRMHGAEFREAVAKAFKRVFLREAFARGRTSASGQEAAPQAARHHEGCTSGGGEAPAPPAGGSIGDIEI